MANLDRRTAVHVTTEALALGVGVPFLLWASFQTSKPAARTGLRLLALTTIAVDGWLLTQYARQK